MTLTPPENVDYSRVEWQAISDIKDGPDLGNLPDFIAPTGSVTFTASVVTLRNPTAAPNPVSILRDPITGVLDSEGYLCTSDENGEPDYRGVELIATDDPDLNPVDWVYNVTYNVRGHNGRQIPLKAHQIYAPAGVTVDLSVVGPVDNATAIGIPAAEALAAQAAAAAADASVAASQALVAAEAAEAALVDSDAFVGSKIAESGSATQTALNAQTAAVVDSRVPPVNMLAEGAAADGTTSDWTAFNAAKAKAGTKGVVYFPAKRGATTTTYYFNASVDLSGTQIMADPSVVIKGTINPNLRDWKLLTPVTLENTAHVTTIRKAQAADLPLAAIAAANVQPQPVKFSPIDFTTWTKRATVSGSLAPATTTTSSATTAANQVSWASAHTHAVDGVVTTPEVGYMYEALIETTGSDGASSVGITLVSADGYESWIRLGYTALSVVPSASFVDALAGKSMNALHGIPSSFGGVVLGFKLVTPRLVEVYSNGLLVYRVPTLKDVSLAGFHINAQDSQLKTISEGVRKSPEYVPAAADQYSVSCVGDSITYGAWSPLTWSNLLQISLAGLPGGGYVNVRQNLAVSSTTAQSWGTSGGANDIATKSFAGDDYVCVLLGTNDIQGGATKANYLTWLTYIASKIVADGARPVFGIPPIFVNAAVSGTTGVTTANPSRGMRLRAALLRWAAVNGYPVALVSDAIGNAYKLYGDNIHPDTLGQAAVSRAFAQAIARDRGPARS